MNLNALLGITGLSLLAFVAAFAFGRLHRSAPSATSPTAGYVASQRLNERQPQSTATRSSMTNVDSMADEDPSQSTSDEADFSESATALAKEYAEPAAARPATPSAAEKAAARKRATENRIAVAARRAHADQLPDDFKKYYAQELPEDAISDELNVRARVSGEQAEVITLSSPAFNSENKDFVLQQVRSELTELGFKRVYITNGKGFRTKTGL
ncbi:hypothetical protein ACW9KT_08910 [Hymenobacter sp. HD11105]